MVTTTFRLVLAGMVVTVCAASAACKKDAGPARLVTELPRIGDDDAVTVTTPRRPQAIVLVAADGTLEVSAAKGDWTSGRPASDRIKVTSGPSLAAAVSRISATRRPGSAPRKAGPTAAPDDDPAADTGTRRAGEEGQMGTMGAMGSDRRFGRYSAVGDERRPPSPGIARGGPGAPSAELLGVASDRPGRAPGVPLAEVSGSAPLILAPPRAPARVVAQVLTATGGMIGVARGDRLAVLRVGFRPAPAELPEPQFDEEVRIQLYLDQPALRVRLYRIGDEIVIPWRDGGVDREALGKQLAELAGREHLADRKLEVDLLDVGDSDAQRLVDVLVALDLAGVGVGIGGSVWPVVIGDEVVR